MKLKLLNKKLRVWKEAGMNQSHYSRYTNVGNSKKGNGAQNEQGPSNRNFEQMQAYIMEAMETISGFAKQLSAPTGSGQTPSDK